jgi:hypothetical protein
MGATINWLRSWMGPIFKGVRVDEARGVLILYAPKFAGEVKFRTRDFSRCAFATNVKGPVVHYGLP